jgi:energy-coupling factor transporter ATP-binding protein EcfA2
VNESLLELTGIQQYYGQSHILREVSLTVPAGACTCLMGRNGVGKTTLLKVIMGLLPARAGQVVFAGQDLTRADTRERARLGRERRAQGAGTVEDEFLARSEKLPVVGAVRIDPEFEHPARRVDGAGNHAVPVQFADVANIDDDDVFVVQQVRRLGDRHGLDDGVGLGDELFDALGDHGAFLSARFGSEGCPMAGILGILRALASSDHAGEPA